MARITHEDVYEVLDTELDEAKVEAFIEDAHRIVNSRCAPYTDDERALAAVETYVAAHLATTRDPNFTEIEHESASGVLDRDGNDYWHTAITVDPTSRLARPNMGIYTT